MQKQVFYLTVTAILFKQATAAPKGGNVEVIAKLCEALRLSESPITFEPKEETSFDGEPTVLKLNMSLAPKEWRDKFVTRSGQNKIEPITTPPPGTPEDWKNMWPRWAAIEAELNKPNGETAILKSYNLETATAVQKEFIRQQVAAYADAAAQALTVHEPKPTEADNAALTEAINSAIYGAGKDASKNLEHTALTGKQPANYATSRGNVGGVEESKTLPHVVASVCGTADGKTNEEPCVRSGGGKVQCQGSDVPQQAR
uniref:Variant surface glycoprotein 1125.1612 n=1 Tax=Trypanosoma brucei TaxID=5691 RepID=M4TCR1_9TRYP|nr:variant surface glycoprotein 1894 [Trypanosoma brucei]APD73788.1 variant surface glycoprotein 1125.1612 [Trypanosoma brucei]